MNELQQLTFTPDGTQEQAAAAALHFEIVSAAREAATCLLNLGRKLKQMRDSAGYKRLGFATFGDYTESMVGIRQRQAYNYIMVAEKVPAQLVEENAAAGITKLALLAQLAQPEQAEVAAQDDLAKITVKELQKIVEERNGLAEQLNMLQTESNQQVVEVQAVEVDAEKIQAEAIQKARQEWEKERADQEAAHARELLELEERANQAEAAAAEVKKEQARQVEAAKKQAEAAAAKKIREAKKEAEARMEQKAQEAAAEATQKARQEQEAADREKVEQARAEAEAAAKTVKELKMQANGESAHFTILFDQMQEKCWAMDELAKTIQKKGNEEQAAKLRNALAGALRAIAEKIEGGKDE